MSAGDAVVLLCSEPIRRRQQGNGIRFLEMAEELSATHRVLLYAPLDERPEGLPFEVRPFDEDDLARELLRARAVVLQGHVSERYFAALDRRRLSSPPLVCDLYDPFLVENLQYVETLGPEIYARDRAVLLGQLARGDRFLVSSRTQVAFYVGLMMGDGTFRARDAKGLEALFTVAPFGVRPPPPRPPGALLRATAAAPDEVLLFFGGVYDWYDPHILLDALAELAPRHRVRAVFSEIPSRADTPQRLHDEVTARVAADPALARRVAFVPWFPHAERLAHLGDAGLAVCLSRPSLETDLSLRTRLLEALNCGVPVIATAGGESAAILAASGGGAIVPAGDRDALRGAIERLLDDEAGRREMGDRGRAWVREHMTWSQTLAPLVEYCRAPSFRSGARPLARPAGVAPAPGADAPFFSVVVPTFNGRPFLDDCLSSLRACDWPRERLEVLVVDNGSTDGSRELVRARFPAARVVALGHNTGFTGAIAEGVAAARGDHLVFLNNDMRVAPGWLAAYAEVLGKGAPCATGLILDWPGERIDFAGGILTFDGHALQRHQGAPANGVRGWAPARTFIACGGNMAVRRDLFQSLGGFDRDFFAYIEDVDFSWRLHAAGHQVTFAPGALAFHHGQGTSQVCLGTYRRGLLYETNAFSTLFKNVDAPYFDALLHAAWRALVNRTMHILADHAPEARFLRPASAPAPSLRRQLGELRRLGLIHGLGRIARRTGRWLASRAPGADLSHPRATAQLEAVARVLDGMDGLHEKRVAVQALRTRPDAEIFRAFPPWIVDTYPGDRELFASPAFRALLPPDIRFRYASIAEVHDGRHALGDHPDV